MDSRLDTGQSAARVKLRRFVYVLLFALGFGILLPGATSFLAGMFYNEDVRDHLPEDAKTRLIAYETEKASLTMRLQGIDTELSKQIGADSLSRVDPYLKLRAYYANELSTSKPPILLVGYYLSRLMLFWPVFYLSIGLLAVVFPPERQGWVRIRQHWKTATLAFLVFLPIYRFPTWLRNFFTGDRERIVYADANYDISKLCFYTQEFMSIINCMLIVVVWVQWLSHYEDRKRQLRDLEPDEPMHALHPRMIDLVSKTFFHWQVASALLGFGFLWYTQFFWHYVVNVGDSRYLLHALVIHATWAFTWVLISLPLATTLSHWQKARSSLIFHLLSLEGRDVAQAGNVLEAIRESHPIGSWNMAVSGVAAIVSFSLPAIDFVITRLR